MSVSAKWTPTSWRRSSINSELEAGLEGFGRRHSVRSTFALASHLYHLWKRQQCRRSLGFCSSSCSHDRCVLASCELLRESPSHQDRHLIFQDEPGAEAVMTRSWSRCITLLLSTRPHSVLIFMDALSNTCCPGLLQEKSPLRRIANRPVT